MIPTLYGCKMLHDSATIQAHHERFVSRVAKSEVVWGLQAPTGDLGGREIEPAELRDQLLDAMGEDRVQQYSERLRTALKQQGK